MNKNLSHLEFLTSVITAGLMYVITYLQYSKNRPYWWAILIVAIFMTANAYVKYKNLNENNKLGN